MATWKRSQERPAEAPSRRPAECSGATPCAPVGDTLPSPRRTAVGLHRTEKNGGLAMENDEEGCTPQPSMSEIAAREENSMPKSPDAADESEGSGDGDGGNLIWWIGTPSSAVDARPELTGGGCCSGAPGAAEAARSGGCHCSQGEVLVAVDGSCSGCCSGPASAAGTPWDSSSCCYGGAPEAARSGGCHCSQGGAVVAVDGSHGGAVAAMGGAAGCGP
nr:uncharacterized protein LOC109746220 [Aegilops tauschii subsp. strangulata]